MKKQKVKLNKRLMGKQATLAIINELDHHEGVASPCLAQHILKLEKQNELLLKAVRWYADPSTWQSYVFNMPPIIETDREDNTSIRGKLARNVLRELDLDI